VTGRRGEGDQPAALPSSIRERNKVRDRKGEEIHGICFVYCSRITHRKGLKQRKAKTDR